MSDAPSQGIKKTLTSIALATQQPPEVALEPVDINLQALATVNGQEAIRVLGEAPDSKLTVSGITLLAAAGENLDFTGRESAITWIQGVLQTYHIENPIVKELLITGYLKFRKDLQEYDDPNQQYPDDFGGW